jgi:hypothetical protein
MENKIGRFLLNSGNVARLVKDDGGWKIFIDKESLKNGDVVCELDAPIVGLGKEE